MARATSWLTVVWETRRLSVQKVVETHATPVEPGRTVVVEATLATSDRAGFRHARKLQRLIRPFIERSARRLWVDDAAYAERLYELRRG